MEKSLEGKGVLVTGGSMGIGLAVARACLAVGARVVINSRHREDLERAAAGMGGAGAGVGVFEADVSVPEQVERLLDHAQGRLKRLDAVIHAAGVYGPIGPALDADPDEWFAAIKINLFGAFLVARGAGLRMRDQWMRDRGGGKIVLFSGGGAAAAFPNFAAYACGKAAVVRFTETLALEVAPFGIEVNALSPGFVATRLHQQTLAAGERAGAEFLAKTQDQIRNGGVPAETAADAAVFLISDRSRGITGKFLAAPYDGWREWPAHLRELQSTDVFTLRRVVPKERGMTWQ